MTPSSSEEPVDEPNVARDTERDGRDVRPRHPAPDEQSLCPQDDVDHQRPGGAEIRQRACEARTLSEIRGARGALSAARAVCRAPARAVRRGRGAARRTGTTTSGPDAVQPGRGRCEPLRRLLPQALVVACLAGGTTAFVADDKSIQLSIDGKPRILHTFADDVAELLDDEGVVVGTHDMVAPAPRTRLSNHDEVAVRHARPLRLTVDGARRQVWTTEHTVGQALRVLGVRPEGAHLSVSRSQRINRTGLTLDVRTARTVRVVADGRTRALHTNAATVRDAVREAGIRLHGMDALSTAAGRFPSDGQTVTVVRIRIGRKIRTEPIPYQVRRVNDPGLPSGTEVVARPGRPGTRRITYATRTVDGVEQRPQRLAAEVVRQPRARQVKVGVGTAAPDAARSGHEGHPGSGGSYGFGKARGDGGRHQAPEYDAHSSVDGLNWAALAQCESGGRPDAVDPSGTYGGLYQFDIATWRSLGGRGRPQDASRAEQTRRAKQLYANRGAAPWPVCGARLTS